MQKMSSLKVVALVGALLGAGMATGVRIDSAGPALRLSQAEVFVELNDTDGDLGLHAAIDGGPWTSLEIEDPRDTPLLNIISRGRLRGQGLTQLFFESAEPPFEELPPAEFFLRFPEGRYEIEGQRTDGGVVTGSAVLSHVLAAPPGNIRLSGLPAAESCDAPDLPSVSVPVVIAWDPVTDSHPEIGTPGRVTVRRYQLFVEGPGIAMSLDLPPDMTEFEVPAVVTAPGRTYKFEIIVRTSTGNNTAVESCFDVR